MNTVVSASARVITCEWWYTGQRFYF